MTVRREQSMKREDQQDGLLHKKEITANIYVFPLVTE